MSERGYGPYALGAAVVIAAVRHVPDAGASAGWAVVGWAVVG
ncbi:hypothetical protein AB0F77_10840 [Streptomyces sp. NPDC026672]